MVGRGFNHAEGVGFGGLAIGRAPSPSRFHGLTGASSAKGRSMEEAWKKHENMAKPTRSPCHATGGVIVEGCVQIWRGVFVREYGRLAATGRRVRKREEPF